ncbi:unnamed protein product [Nesidiocoris tenuis]|uniref:Uncharacterized protein n=1 Tax=Nesidiocoris tenuis TaxID=355587 RepID=A0A6H5GMS6_9HEMI|nr:unnamed protein product [Nesidiocoris tenuis]
MTLESESRILELNRRVKYGLQQPKVTVCPLSFKLKFLGGAGFTLPVGLNCSPSVFEEEGKMRSWLRRRRCRRGRERGGGEGKRKTNR